MRLPTSLTLALLFAASQPCVSTAAAPLRPGETFTLHFERAEIEGVARTMSDITGYNVVVDPHVKGTMSLDTERPVTAPQAWRQFLAALRLQGYTAVDGGGFYKIVPESDAKAQASTVVGGAAARPAGDQVATEIFRLDYENAGNLLPVLRPLVSPNNVVNVNVGNNSIVVTDYAGNLARLRTLVAALDVPGATDVQVIALQHGTAAEIAATVRRLLPSSAVSSTNLSTGDAPGAAGQAASAVTSGAAGGGAANVLSIVADTQGNNLLVRAPSRAQLASVRALVAQLDRPRDNVNVRVVYLKNAEAARIAQVLRAAFPADSTGATANSASTGSSSPAAAAASPSSGIAAASSGGSSTSGKSSSGSVTAAAQPSTGGGIQADPATNALVITAPEARFREMRPIIEQLDSRRAQLYVESLVVEVDASKSVELGVQWSQLFDISSTSTLTLGTVAKALESMAGTNILSTANVVTLDNEEARIVVGQNVPFITGSYTSSTNSNPFQTVDRKDVGITLRIRPQIGENGNIRMTIYQESSSVASTSSTLGPTTNQRSIESTVMVNDGKIIVLGGLIEDKYSDEAYQLPWVSDIPLLGGVFRNISRSRKKTNLMVFLRPVEMRDAASAASLSLDRYDYIGAQGAALPVPIQQMDKAFVAPPVMAPAGR